MAVTKLSNSGIKTGILKYDSFLAGNTAYDPAATWLIQRTTLTTTTATISFSSIPQTYQHLQIRFIAKDTTTTSVSDHLYLTMNGLTTSTYYNHTLYGDNTTIGSTSFLTQPNLIIRNSVFRSNATYANMFGVGIIDIHDYKSTSKHKTIRAFSGRDGNGDGTVALSSGVYPSTSAITTIALAPGSGSFVAGTSIALYGITG